MGCFITGDHIRIGENTILNRNCCIDGREGVTIGNNVSISPQTCILSMSHEVNSPGFDPVRKETRIDDYAWIGVRAILLPGASLGKGAVVGAGAVVTRPVEPFTIVAGNPARTIGERNRELTYSLRYRPFFNTDIE